MSVTPSKRLERTSLIGHPEFNPIEFVFSKLTWLLRAATLRTVEALWNVLCNSPDRFPAEKCAHYFRHCVHATPA